MRRPATLVLALALGEAGVLGAEERVDLEMVTRIRDEGFNNSQVMETLAGLTDVIGPRLTGSPQMRRANDWTRERLASWGLSGARLEGWGPFGRGWTLERVSVQMVVPQKTPLIALPKAWTPGTPGIVRGRVVRAKLDSEVDLQAEKGKLGGTVVLLGEMRDLKNPEKPLFTRYSDKDLEDLAHFEVGERRRGGPVDRPAAIKRFRFQKALREFLSAEKVLATLECSDRDGGVIRVMGAGSRERNEDPGVPTLVVAAEQYNRMARLLERKVGVEVELDVRATLNDDDPMAYNTVAEIPGSDVKKGEVVMIGAHMDSWHAGTGATDNAAGTAVAMEAMRILKALDVHPRRTVRVGLWSGEEQGLLGSRAYVSEHFASRPEPTDPEQKALPRYLRSDQGPLSVKPGHARLSAYFNMDNGTGRIRGIYAQQNAAAVPIFEAWLRPFSDLGANTVTMRGTGGTDHQAFDSVGLPGFQFIQDEADYSTRTHHTNMDVYDRLQREDLMQASVILASFAYHAAVRDGSFPRKPLPRIPAPETSPSSVPSPSAPREPTSSGSAQRP